MRHCGEERALAGQLALDRPLGRTGHVPQPDLAVVAGLPLLGNALKLKVSRVNRRLRRGQNSIAKFEKQKSNSSRLKSDGLVFNHATLFGAQTPLRQYNPISINTPTNTNGSQKILGHFLSPMQISYALTFSEIPLMGKNLFFSFSRGM